MSRGLVLLVLLASSAAFAQPGPDDPPSAARVEDFYPPEPDHTFAIEPSLGGVAPGSGVLMMSLAGSWRAPGSATWWRVAVDVGHSVPDVAGGVVGLRAGIERHRSLCLRGCFYYGVDMAVVDLTADDYPEHTELRAALAVARGGVDLGGDRVRVRFGLEIFAGLGAYHQVLPDLVMPVDSTDLRFAGGYALTSAFVLRF